MHARFVSATKVSNDHKAAMQLLLVIFHLCVIEGCPSPVGVKRKTNISIYKDKLILGM